MNFFDVVWRVGLLLAVVVGIFWFIGYSMDAILDDGWNVRVWIFVAWVILISIAVWLVQGSSWVMPT